MPKSLVNTGFFEMGVIQHCEKCYTALRKVAVHKI